MAHSRFSTTFRLAAFLFFAISVFGHQADQEAKDYFKKWLNEDVVYLITPEEREIFQQLQTDEERERFIEEFWRRRDSDPATSVNETKEEHYRRIAYANGHFRSGKRGWRTDRGMIYIKFGAPVEIDAHPSGGSYKRPFWEGGGSTSTYPFEVWRYKHIPGIGSDVEIEFVDPTMTGEYRLARDPLEKDALLFVPGAGNTLAEAEGAQDRIDRIRYRSLGNITGEARIHPEYQPLRLKDYPMERLQLYFDVQRPPELKFKDLQELVTTHVSYHDLPFESRTDYLQISPDTSLVRLSLQVRHWDLFYLVDRTAGIAQARVNIFGQVENLGGEIVYVFEDDVASQSPLQEVELERSGSSLYQKSFPLTTGRYKLVLALKDLYGDKISTSTLSVLVQKTDPQQLASSSIMLTERILPDSELQDYGSPFVYHGFKFYPNIRHRFSTQDPYLRAYLEIYDLGVDQQTLEPGVEVAYEVRQNGQVVRSNPRPVNDVRLDDDRAIIYPAISLRGLPVGSYELRVLVTDKVTGRTIEPRTEFQIQHP